MRSEIPDSAWFDEAAAAVYGQLERTEKFLADFKRSVGYLKLLAELDLLKGELEEEDESSLGESVSLGSDPGSYRDCGEEGELRGSHDTAALECQQGLSAEITSIDLARENGTGGKQFVNYVVAVSRTGRGWQVLRRYSDFLAFYQSLTSQFPDTAGIPFPGKKTFGNLER